MRLSLIVAASTNDVIGARGGLPWQLPDDLRYFKRKTLGKPVVMGRRTWDSLGRPLPGRHNIVMTHKSGFEAQGADVAASPEAALKLAGDAAEVMVIGGGEVFDAFMDRAGRIYLTRVHADVDGDTFFAEPDAARFALVSSEPHPADERHAFAFEFRVYDRL